MQKTRGVPHALLASRPPRVSNSVKRTTPVMSSSRCCAASVIVDSVEVISTSSALTMKRPVPAEEPDAASLPTHPEKRVHFPPVCQVWMLLGSAAEDE